MTFDLSIDDGIAVVTLRRPEQLNTLTRATTLELAAVFDETDRDDTVRAVVVTGRGRAFCAGADLAAMASGGGVAEANETRDFGGILTMRIFESVKPVIAAVNGVAAGMGATMQLPMDFRLASTDARFGFVFARRGLMPESASSWFLPRLVGPSKALEWLYSGRVFSAQEALDAGLVHSLYEPSELLDAAVALGHALTDRSAPVSVALTRRMVWRMMTADHPMVAHLMESSLLPDRALSADTAEGMEAFLTKREPVWRDKVSDGLPPIARNLGSFASTL
ncbi:enoyl-CoA hydratase-related protein [Georgenia sp. SYP-B2076]|uniref:enoyl-CoA hydratase-related protein n=1 Tax=Georgenia sp. SYP-B2076 TaxID=2495881 RepID=UPI00197A99F8|nr:enoyl-CoA hydratase-related protein [Georgenia sp. SYP-B2076]